MNNSLQQSGLHFFQEMRTVSSSNSGRTQMLSVTDQPAISDVDRDRDRESLKNSVLFKRQYLSNGKSDRNKTQ